MNRGKGGVNEGKRMKNEGNGGDTSSKKDFTHAYVDGTCGPPPEGKTHKTRCLTFPIA